MSTAKNWIFKLVYIILVYFNEELCLKQDKFKYVIFKNSANVVDFILKREHVLYCTSSVSFS
jgi:hypothetical protein